MFRLYFIVIYFIKNTFSIRRYRRKKYIKKLGSLDIQIHQYQPTFGTGFLDHSGILTIALSLLKEHGFIMAYQGAFLGLFQHTREITDKNRSALMYASMSLVIDRDSGGTADYGISYGVNRINVDEKPNNNPVFKKYESALYHPKLKDKNISTPLLIIEFFKQLFASNKLYKNMSIIDAIEITKSFNIDIYRYYPDVFFEDDKYRFNDVLIKDNNLVGYILDESSCRVRVAVKRQKKFSPSAAMVSSHKLASFGAKKSKA